MAGARNRFTIFDMMEAKGHFDVNPANAQARTSDGTSLYEGPVEYPKMLYHPKGEERIVEPARREATQLGVIEIPAKTELIYRVVQSEREDKKLLADGWHDHPAKAVAASGRPMPDMGAGHRLANLERELKKMTAERDRLAGLVPEALAQGDAQLAGLTGSGLPHDQAQTVLAKPKLSDAEAVAAAVNAAVGPQ